MTFDLSDEQQAARERARAFAHGAVEARAAEIDRTSALPADLAREAVALVAESNDAVSMVLTIEEIAAASGALATASAESGRRLGARMGLSGLRGATPPENSPRGQLVLAAVALGLGKAATEHALADLRQAATSRGTDGEKPHWVVADAATELEAARLLTYKAALAEPHDGATEIAIARLMASAAAQRAVDAALRIAGPDAYQDGSVLERVARDVRAVALLMGTEEQQRATAAEGLLPQ